MTAFILDLDGTLIDSVYQHVFAWHSALRSCGFTLPMWRIHRKIGMSGGLLLQALALELNREIDAELGKKLEDAHSQIYATLRESTSAFDHVRELLETFERLDVPYAIATTGSLRDTEPSIEQLHLPDNVPVITREDTGKPKPDPSLFLAAAKKLRTRSEETMVVGDSVWDMLAARRAHFLGIGLLSGGYAESELTGAGAYRVFADAGDLRRHLHEAGVEVTR
ncbi:MAG TPA: HAD family hydrolase [Candidatus Baltobacteraceae bacterium]|nr:HAD family hydrolase [Candidatus Baltobacteraceae bacterium]